MKTDVTKMTDTALVAILDVLDKAKVRTADIIGVWDILYQVKQEYRHEAERRFLSKKIDL